MSKHSSLFVEDYRPKTIQDCILPKNLKTSLLEFVKKGEIPSLIFVGMPGSGKCLSSDTEIDIMVSDKLYSKLVVKP